jgi:hypothetical protein
MKIKTLLLVFSALMTCGTILAGNNEERHEVAEFRKLLTESLSRANITTWALPDSLEPNARMNFYLGAKGEKPKDGYPVFIYLHGSGPRENEWATGLRLARMFQDGPSMYIVPQIPQEVRNRATSLQHVCRAGCVGSEGAHVLPPRL